MNPIKAAGLESTDQKLKKIGGPKKKGSLKNNIGKHKTHMSHLYICNNGFFYIYIYIYVCIYTFFWARFLYINLFLAKSFWVRQWWDRTKQNPHKCHVFRWVIKSKVLFWLNTNTYSPNLLIQSCPMFFWIEINSGWHRSNHPPFHPKKNRKVKVQNSSDLPYQTPAAATWYPFCPVWASWIVKARGEQTHHTNCHAQPGSQPFHPCERSNVPQWIDDPPKGRHKKITQFLPPNTCKLANQPQQQVRFGATQGGNPRCLRPFYPWSGLPNDKDLHLLRSTLPGAFLWFLFSLPRGRKVGRFLRKTYKKYGNSGRMQKKKKESPEKKKKHHHSPWIIYVFFSIGMLNECQKKKVPHFCQTPQNWWKNWVVLYILLQKKGTFPSHGQPNPAPTLQC